MQAFEREQAARETAGDPKREFSALSEEAGGESETLARDLPASPGPAIERTLEAAAPEAKGVAPSPEAEGVASSPEVEGVAPSPEAEGVAPSPEAEGVAPSPEAEGEAPSPEAKGVAAAPVPSLSLWAQCGSEAMAALERGEAVADETVARLVAAAMRAVPVSQGWLLDGYPTTRQQAELLERELVPPRRGGWTRIAARARDFCSPRAPACVCLLLPGPGNTSVLAPPVEAVEESASPVGAAPTSALLNVMLLDTPEEVCLERATGRRVDPETGQAYHLSHAPPPSVPEAATASAEDAAVLGLYARLEAPEDPRWADGLISAL